MDLLALRKSGKKPDLIGLNSHALQGPYFGSHGMPPTRSVYARLPMPAQRTSESSSAASGSESPFAFQGLNGSTLVPPGDEHTDALFQSLMSMPTKAVPQHPHQPQQQQLQHHQHHHHQQQQQTSGRLPDGGRAASGDPSRGRLTGLGTAPPPPPPPPCGAVDVLLARALGGPGQLGFGAGGDGGSRGSQAPPLALYRDEDGQLPRPMRHAAAANVLSYDNTLLQCHRAASAATAATAAGLSADVKNGIALVRQQLEQLEHGALSETTAEIEAHHLRGQDAMFEGGTRQLAGGRVAAPGVVANQGLHQQHHHQGFPHQQKPMQQGVTDAVAAVAAPATQQRHHQRWQPPMPHQRHHPEHQLQAGDRTMRDAQIAMVGATAGTAGPRPAMMATTASAVARKDWDDGIQIGAAAAAGVNNRSGGADGDGIGTSSARQRRRTHIAGTYGVQSVTVEKDASSEGQVAGEKEACNSSIGTAPGVDDGGGKGASCRNGPTGSVGGLSGRDVEPRAIDHQGEPGTTLARGGSGAVPGGECAGEGQLDGEYGGGIDEGDDEDDTTDGGGDYGSPLRQSRKRTASQRRRGSASAKRELCRERNRTAQRRFRERQKDLIRALQDQVEHQEALIKDLKSRLAVYEGRTSPQAAPPLPASVGPSSAAEQQAGCDQPPNATSTATATSNGN
ncbi:hypothetical protein VOLCADRAFT_97157 [Volvox carteri f. nagariensis]|uniref:BZIP domain-containing protein n=1 Tax=Volvox carteri f. nagariensis TaxID=3068 RepID=D8UC11_VOLCA|nr:uncharacterized protein VOLCADRAFT_97157 [Volvox carteri f. nagariensis]EFJ42714.1 hypothetical protein VOLCADRAFT_97157 [Volvox carteri f. nagariensis]|eukprot:XP_002956175.1 hypothetical protein VOLCADRAFT_97157 [Volvox carteri f. nagariensis]